MPKDRKTIESPGDYKLNELTIEPIDANRIDVRALMEEINIFEDLFQPTMTGNILLRDSVNLPHNLPILGHEKMRIKIDVPVVQNALNFTGFIYNIASREPIKDADQQYILNFTSIEMLTNLKTRISRSYRTKYAEQVVGQIIKNDLLSEKKYFFEESLWPLNFVVPNWQPIKTINWIAARTTSKDAATPSYLFYEDNNGLHFRSIESMIASPVKQKFLYSENTEPGDLEYIFQPANIREADNPFARTLDSDMRAIRHYSIENEFDILRNLHGGMYGSNLVTHDVYYKKWQRHTFDYLKTWKNYGHLGNAPLCNHIEGEYSGSPNQRCSTLPKHAMQWDNYPTNGVEYWKQFRESLMGQSSSVRINIVIAGDSTLRPGDVVRLKIPSIEHQESSKQVIDTYYSGKFMVTSIHHVINKEEYTMHIELIKDSLSREILGGIREDSETRRVFIN